MRILRVLFAVASLTIPGVAHAEKPPAAGDKAEDTVVLKGGGAVTGKILDEDPKNGVTIKLANGKVQVIPAAQVKSVERADAAPKKRPPPKDEPEDKPAPPPPPPPKASDGAEPRRALLGAGLDVGVVLSRNNSGGSITFLSPLVGAHATFVGTATPKLYFQADVGIATFTRKSSVSQPGSIDTTGAPVVTNQEITTRNRALLFTVTPQVGYDVNDLYGFRGGLILGFGRSTGTSTAALHGCPSDGSQGALVYGMRVVPASVRAMRSLEVSVVFDYEWVPMPRCFVPNLDKGLNVQGGGVTEIYPTFQNKTIAVGTFGLSATYSFR